MYRLTTLNVEFKKFTKQKSQKFKTQLFIVTINI